MRDIQNTPKDLNRMQGLNDKLKRIFTSGKTKGIHKPVNLFKRFIKYLKQ